MSINKQMLIAVISLIILMVIFRFLDFDMLIQDKLYNFYTDSWFLGHNNKWHFYLYSGLKQVLFIVISMFVCILILFTLLSYFKIDFIKANYRGLIITTLSIILVPLTVVAIKWWTNIPCPSYLTHFGGHYPYVRIFEFQPFYLQTNIARCWPAGHASLGFGFMSLFYLFKSKKFKIIGLTFGLLLGWVMGIYKMLIGDHFLSHNIDSMLIGWIVILIIVKVIDFVIATFKKNSIKNK